MVATLGASSYTFVEAAWTQSLPDWIASHVRAFGFFAGVTAQIVSDNLKAGVTKACIYDPAVNRTYVNLAAHYHTAVAPARPHKPKDKSKVEAAVLLVERLDKPALKPLPVAPYVYAEWKKCRAGPDYHTAIDRHYCLVPHQLLKKELWACLTDRTVEVFHVRTCVASHVRTSGNGQHSTQRDHMPAHHRFREDWTPQRIQARPARIGPNVAIFAEVVMRDRKHLQQGYRICLGVIRLADRFGSERLDTACRRRARNQRQIMLIDPIHSEEWAGDQAPHPRHGGARHHPHQHPWRRLIPLRKGQIMLNHPTLDHLKALPSTAWPKSLPNYRGRTAPPNGWLCSLIGKPPVGKPNASRPGCARPGCVM